MRHTRSARTWALRSPAAPRNVLIFLLAFTAGCVDAISYLVLGRVFTANMTGNTVLLGLAIAQAQWLAVLRSAVALAGYLAGVAAGALLNVRRATGAQDGLWPPVVTTICLLELLILLTLTVAGSLLPSPSAVATVDVLIALSAVAMGLQSVAASTLGIRGVATTYITGTWTTMMSGLVSKVQVAERAGAERSHGTALQAVVVGDYLLAAVVGGVAATRWHLVALVVPTAAMAAVVTTAWLRLRPQND